MTHADILNNMIVLNEDVLSEIFIFIPQHIKRNLNKDLYQKSQPFPILRMDSFLRTIIRKDYAFIFNYYLIKRYHKWRKITRWIYKNMRFHYYTDYLRYLCCEYESEHCKEKLNILENKLKPKAKKKYKKIRIRNIRWNN